MILKPTKENLQTAADLLGSEELVALPTETVYGLAANALSVKAVDKIFKLKKRSTTNPLIIHLKNDSEIASVTGELSSWQSDTLDKLKSLWPGPLTIVLPKSDKIPMETTARGQSIALRIPSDPIFQSILELVDFPLAAPSANISKKVSPTKAQHVEDEFGTDLTILDGGNCTVGIESTVVSLLNDKASILRPGLITKAELEDMIGPIDTYNNSNATAQISPGQELVHYSPDTRIEFFDPKQNYTNLKAGLITLKTQEANSRFIQQRALSKNGDLAEAAQQLFATIREFDKMNLDLILIERCEAEGIGAAIIDRLNRATKK